MPSDLLEAALAVVRSYWEGSAKTKIELSKAMSDLRIAVYDEQKRRAQDDTTRITK